MSTARAGFSINKTSTGAGYGRAGHLRLPAAISTPCLFPVVCLMTGSTARGGGLWKYILQADTTNGLLRRDLPILSQVLHFLDFNSLGKAGLDTWRSTGLKARYNSDVLTPQEYTAPIFLDSGGFKLLWNESVDLSRYGLTIKDGKGPQTILDLQRDLGGDIVATLDYPLPPGLDRIEAQERMGKSLDNAVAAARRLQADSTYSPFLYLAAHGQDRAGIGEYVRQAFDRFQGEPLRDFPFGLAVGSLVPLRGAKKYSTIIGLLQGVRQSIPEERRDTTPIHVFGISGNLIPLLAYLGVDSFDSSTYVQEARSLGYIDPTTARPRPVLEMSPKDWTCKCRVCQNVDLTTLQTALTSDVRNKPIPGIGEYKSKYYGDIALHNLELDFNVVAETRSAIEGDSLQEYLIEHTRRFPALKPALDALSQGDPSLQTALTRTQWAALALPVPTQAAGTAANNTAGVDLPAPSFVSLRYTADSFDILSDGYQPPEGRDILIVIPCSGEKPYSSSRTHKIVSERLTKALGESTARLHSVTLSGLYGPVPVEYEDAPEVVGYDFRLEPANEAQIKLVTERLVEYLRRHRARYSACIGYATSLSYRRVLENAARSVERFEVLPRKPKTRRLTEFFRRENLQELVFHAQIALNAAAELTAATPAENAGGMGRTDPGIPPLPPKPNEGPDEDKRDESVEFRAE